MGYLETAAKLIGYLSVIGGLITALVKVWKEQKQARDGQLCLLRTEMLKIYHRNKDKGTLRQYEAENFKLMYEAYKARGGNSFIDEVHKHVVQWELEI